MFRPKAWPVSQPQLCYRWQYCQFCFGSSSAVSKNAFWLSRTSNQGKARTSNQGKAIRIVCRIGLYNEGKTSRIVCRIGLYREGKTSRIVYRIGLYHKGKMSRIVCRIGLKAAFFFSLAVVCLIGLDTKRVCSVLVCVYLVCVSYKQVCWPRWLYAKDGKTSKVGL